MKRLNKKIKNATECKIDGITFKSQLEKSIYSTLQQLGFNPQYEPKTFILWEGFTPITPFYDRETTAQQTKRINSGDLQKGRILIHKKGKIIGIRYTPDFYFKYKDLDVYIEAKGIENDLFYIKKKLFRYLLDKQLEEKGQHSIFFEIYTKAQLLQSIEIMKNYELTISKDSGGNKSTSK